MIRSSRRHASSDGLRARRLSRDEIDDRLSSPNRIRGQVSISRPSPPLPYYRGSGRNQLSKRITLCAVWLIAMAALAGCRDTADQSTAEPETASIGQPVVLRTDDTGLTQTRTAKAVKANVEGRFENAVLARRNADGSLTTECHNTQEGSEAFLNAPVTAA